MSHRHPDPARERRIAIRTGVIIAWSAFLTASVATMVCFAFIDPLEFAEGAPPAWWSSRMHVYAIGFFFFWGVGAGAAALTWILTRARRAARHQ